MPPPLSRVRPLRVGSRADPGSIAVVLVLLVLWASMGVTGVTTAEPLGSRPAPMQSAGDEADDESDDTGLPLEVDGLVPLDMTEGSWISLDVSPDGETIVFDFLGDLFTIPIAGGDETQLTSGMAFDAQPRFSPDGSRIVYTSDAEGGQNVWVMDSDGSDPVQISKGGSNRAELPEWMPDGDYVVAAMGAFRLSGLPKLKLFHVDGGSGVQLIAEPDNLKTLGPRRSSATRASCATSLRRAVAPPAAATASSRGLGYHWELWAMAAAGMKGHDALRMATIMGADTIGLAEDRDSIEPGKLADLVVLTGNPLDDLRNTNTFEQVMLNGRLYDGDTLDEVYPRERPLPPLWWWDEEPADVPGLGR